MFWLKSCPRCHGDLNENTGIYGNYISCLQCGHYLTAVEEAYIRAARIGSSRSTQPVGESWYASQLPPVCRLRVSQRINTNLTPLRAKPLD